jgi:hypothetical protein
MQKKIKAHTDMKIDIFFFAPLDADQATVLSGYAALLKL